MLTSFGRVRRMTERAAKRLPSPPRCSSSTSTATRTSAALGAELGERWGRVDGVVHAIAYAPADALGGGFLQAPRESAADRVRDQRLLAEGARRRRSRR